MRKILAVTLSVLLGCSELFAALDVRTVYEFNPSATAGNVNGGGFDPFASVANMIADLACTGATTSAPVCSSATYNFVAGDVGHFLFISSGGTYTANSFWAIASVAANQATLTAGAGTGNVIPNGAAGTTIWTTNASAGIASTGSPTGGVFSIDRSRSTAAVQTTTTATNTVGVITVGSLTYDKSWIGNVVQIVAGTGATQGWYEITNAVLNTSFTLDRDPSGTTNISINLGGALSLGSSTANRTDDIVFELGSGTNGTGSSRFFVKTGTYTTLTAVSIAASCGTQAPCRISGYSTVRDDAPTGSSRPAWPMGTISFTGGTNWELYNLSMNGSAAATLLTLGTNGKLVNSKVVQTNTTGTRTAIAAGIDSLVLNSEGVSYRGHAYNNPNVSASVINSYFHDSVNGITDTSTTTAQTTYIGNIIESNVTAAINFTGAKTSLSNIFGNTLFGSTNTTGTGILIATGGTDINVRNNIITGFATGISHADAGNGVGNGNYNDYSNNDTDVTNWQKGPNDVTTAPAFTSVSQVTGTTATTTAGNHLVQSGATFVTSGVTAGRDYVYVVSGTGVTAGVYGISSVDSETQITTDITLSANATADKVFQITTGRNFAPTAPQSSLAGFPGAFQGAVTTGYQTVGAIQKNSAGGGGGIIGQ